MKQKIKCTLWHAVAALAGGAAGALTAQLLSHTRVTESATVPAWLLLPFMGLLGCIAIVPLFHPHTWERHYADFSLALGTFTIAIYAALYGVAGSPVIGHTALEYFQFMALIGGLFIVSGGILIDVHHRGRPLGNTLLLGTGAILANLVGTTGASMLLIRPFLRINHGRIRPFHVVFFIMIVSNCGGCLTPLGDPPLFLGFLKGVPFTWPLLHLWQYWLMVNGLLLSLFFISDCLVQREDGKSRVTPIPPSAATPLHSQRGFSVSGWQNIVLMVLFLGVLLADEPLKRLTGYHAMPFGALFQVIIALTALRVANPDIMQENEFTLKPVREVGFLFAGIFATMIPALAFLQQNSGTLGVQSPRDFYYVCGGLSAVLDNAPTYLSFVQTALGLSGTETLPAFLAASPANHKLLEAISTSAVFFGAMTYIGNGPNFMVKSIADSAQVRTPTFLGYLGYSLLILLPILVATFWLLGGQC